MYHIEQGDNPITQVHFPSPRYKLWAGRYGTARVHDGDYYVVLSDGTKRNL